MKGFIEITDEHGIETLINVSQIKRVWKQTSNRTSIQLQGDSLSEFITTTIPFDEFKCMIMRSGLRGIL